MDKNEMDVSAIAKAAWDEAWRLAFGDGLSAGHPLGRSYLDCDKEWADSDVVSRIAALTAQSASAQQAPVDLTGLADRLLASREIVRDEDGHLFNPAFPILDEGDDVRMFLGAFGVECCQVSMESDCDDEALRDAVWAGEKGCSEWFPTQPEGEGWLLSDIFDTEDGPYALFIRRKPKEPKKSRRVLALETAAHAPKDAP